MEKNIKQIVLDIKRNKYLNKGNMCYRSSENGVICRMECSEYSPEELIGKQVVYYIYANGMHYFGRTDSFDRRMSEHLRRDGRLFKYFQNNEFIVKPMKIFDYFDTNNAEKTEKEAIAFAKMIIDNKKLINKKV